MGLFSFSKCTNQWFQCILSQKIIRIFYTYFLKHTLSLFNINKCFVIIVLDMQQTLRLQVTTTDYCSNSHGHVYYTMREALTWAMNWIIFTNILRGVSRGTTLREPLGKSADTMLIRRLQQKKKKISHKEIMRLIEHQQTIFPILHNMSRGFLFLHKAFVMLTKIPLVWYFSFY